MRKRYGPARTRTGLLPEACGLAAGVAVGVALALQRAGPDGLLLGGIVCLVAVQGALVGAGLEQYRLLALTDEMERTMEWARAEIRRAAVFHDIEDILAQGRNGDRDRDRDRDSLVDDHGPEGTRSR